MAKKNMSAKTNSFRKDTCFFCVSKLLREQVALSLFHDFLILSADSSVFLLTKSSVNGEMEFELEIALHV